MSDAAVFVAPENARLKLFATLIICAGSLFTVFTLPDSFLELDIYRYCAYTMIVTLALAVGVEGLGGIRSLIRVDIVAICTLYFLTFAEFLHPHVRLLYEQVTGGANLACQLVLTGLSCIAIGRHISFAPRSNKGKKERISLPEISPRAIITIFFLFAFLGYFYVLLVTYFNPLEIVTQLLRPRFMRPWQRAQEGGWISFLTELQLLLYLVAALGGYIFANASRFDFRVRIGVVAILLFILFFDFSEGARNVVLIKVGLFLVTYFISSHRAQSLRIILLSITGLFSIWIVSGYMLDFRNQGLGNYLTEGTVVADDGGFMIDNNMVSIARVVGVFPSMYPFPGTDIVRDIFTKWVPRALWPDKPVSWSTSIEDALNTGGGYTLAVTFVGEAYLIAGYPSLIIVSLLIGIATAAWTRVGLAARTNLDLIYYASGFFAATLGMRSVQFVSVAMIPTVAFYIFGRYLLRQPRRPRYAV